VVKPIFKLGYFAKTNFSAADAPLTRKATVKTSAATTATLFFICLLLSFVH
jgi:hypothetical protein